MDAVASGDIELDNRAVAHLDSCLGCLACESACPSGVSYGQRLEQFRPRLAQAPRYTRATLRRVVSRRVASSTRLLRTALGVAHGLDALGLSAIRRRLPGLALLPARDRRHRSS
ncbi:MAG: 4Fe-4S binding protein, partial [Candidatus Binatia bacterium]